MTEAVWLACTEPALLLTDLGDRGSQRKLRLFAVACCRPMCPIYLDERSREAVRVAELFADGVVDEKERERAYTGAFLARTNQDDPHFHATDAAWYATFSPVRAADVAIETAIEAGMDHVNDSDFELLYADKSAGLSRILRDIIGNPFRPLTVDSIWLMWNDRSAKRIAQAIYDDRAFDRMPILADALEDAGCDNAECAKKEQVRFHLLAPLPGCGQTASLPHLVPSVCTLR